MKILTVGGGSGGHVTPVVAVLREIRDREPDAELRFWCDRSFLTQARDIVHHFDADMRVDSIVSGKFRRYHHLTVWRQLMMPKIVFANIFDVFKIGAGVIQSLVKLLVWRPDVVFTKGGYVCLPVGFVAHLLGIPLVIHDSDAHPGLTNRILSRWARSIATGAPLEYYPYPKQKTHYVGIPTSAQFVPPTAETQREAKRRWGVDESRPLVVVTGGGLGATRINNTVMAVRDQISKIGSLILISGTAQYDELRAQVPNNDMSFQLHGFVSEGMAGLLGAADVVVARAGATTIMELAALKRPTILIPNARLTGGHQVKNAAVYADADAVIVMQEEEMTNSPSKLAEAIVSVVQDDERAALMGERFYAFAKPDAAKDMASLVLSAGTKE